MTFDLVSFGAHCFLRMSSAGLIIVCMYVCMITLCWCLGGSGLALPSPPWDHDTICKE